MSNLGKDLRSYLLDQAEITNAVSQRIHQNQTPEGYDGPYIWFARGTTQSEDGVNDPTGEQPFFELFNFEAVSDDGSSYGIADALRALHNYRGSLGVGKGTVQDITVSDHTDDYLPKNLFDNSGFDVASLQIEIAGYVPAQP